MSLTNNINNKISSVDISETHSYNINKKDLEKKLNISISDEVKNYINKSEKKNSENNKKKIWSKLINKNIFDSIKTSSEINTENLLLLNNEEVFNTFIYKIKYIIENDPSDTNNEMKKKIINHIKGSLLIIWKKNLIPSSKTCEFCYIKKNNIPVKKFENEKLEEVNSQRFSIKNFSYYKKINEMEKNIKELNKKIILLERNKQDKIISNISPERNHKNSNNKTKINFKDKTLKKNNESFNDNKNNLKTLILSKNKLIIKNKNLDSNITPIKTKRGRNQIDENYKGNLPYIQNYNKKSKDKKKGNSSNMRKTATSFFLTSQINKFN